ncbi:MAG: hypothetical protein PF961_03590 [Planctomycetota bacterium]|jgi:hypothetical protein|nr:hypothetical protein [Planctomycetota bacterium]
MKTALTMLVLATLAACGQALAPASIEGRWRIDRTATEAALPFALATPEDRAGFTVRFAQVEGLVLVIDAQQVRIEGAGGNRTYRYRAGPGDPGTLVLRWLDAEPWGGPTTTLRRANDGTLLLAHPALAAVLVPAEAP